MAVHRLRRSSVVVLACCALVGRGPTAFTQGSRSAAGADSRRRAVATRVTEAPVVDGVLDERVWQQASPIAEFVQAEPSEGQPATEKTEVRVVYDDQAVYVGVICYDSD